MILKAEMIIYGELVNLSGKMPVAVEVAAPRAKFPALHGYILVDADRLNCIRMASGAPVTFSDPALIMHIVNDIMSRAGL